MNIVNVEVIKNTKNVVGNKLFKLKKVYSNNNIITFCYDNKYFDFILNCKVNSKLKICCRMKDGSKYNGVFFTKKFG